MSIDSPKEVQTIQSVDDVLAFLRESDLNLAPPATVRMECIHAYVRCAVARLAVHLGWKEDREFTLNAGAVLGAMRFGGLITDQQHEKAVADYSPKAA